jgi:dTDP-4-dehydrorhamnose 3,5-epimerase
MMNVRIKEIAGLRIIEPRKFEDERGYFFEAYNEEELRAQDIDTHFVQDNQSFSHYGVIRGLHYQLPPFDQVKLVRVLAGTILDITVDIRKGSSSFGKHAAIEISAENNLQLLIPSGFAHGFSVLSESAVILYKCDRKYYKESEAGILYNDPALAIDWKIPAGKEIVSAKDRALPSFKECRNTFGHQRQEA